MATGKVQLVYKPFPRLGIESHAAARAAFCASEQGQFWPYHDKLFANWRGVQTGAFAPDRLLTFAGELGLDTAEWSQCMQNSAADQHVAASLAQGEQLGVQGTPTFIITAGGKSAKLVGAVPYADLRRVVAAALEQP